MYFPQRTVWIGQQCDRYFNTLYLWATAHCSLRKLNTTLVKIKALSRDFSTSNETESAPVESFSKDKSAMCKECKHSCNNAKSTTDDLWSYRKQILKYKQINKNNNHK